MFSISFRILVGSFHGVNIYVNGSTWSDTRLKKGTIIEVRGNGLSDAIAEVATVIESSSTQRQPNSYLWEIV
jgi:hypothetical protein